MGCEWVLAGADQVERKERDWIGPGQMEDSWLRKRELPGGWPPPPLLGERDEEEEGSGSISTLLSSITGIRTSSSDRGVNSGWDMKLWMELLDSGFSRPSYRELRKALTTLI